MLWFKKWRFSQNSAIFYKKIDHNIVFWKKTPIFAEIGKNCKKLWSLHRHTYMALRLGIERIGIEPPEIELPRIKLPGIERTGVELPGSNFWRLG
jgi:hypothetical protein